MRAGVAALRVRRLLVSFTTALALVSGVTAVRAADEPSLPDALLEPSAAARPEPAEPPAADAKPRSVNLWPLFQYESDPAARTRRVRIFGPLIELSSDAERQRFAFRPFVSIDQARGGHDDHTSFFGPLLRSHWGQTEQVTTAFGGLFTYRTRTSADGLTLEEQNVRLLPLYFYQWKSPAPSGRLSVIPIYADVDDLFGYERVELAAFPAYVHVQRPSLDRYYFPYPIISRDGPEGSGYRLWPFPLRDRHGRRIERGAPARPAAAEHETYFPVMRDELEATAPARDADPS